MREKEGEKERDRKFRVTKKLAKHSQIETNTL
jgi:hypothetical protein